MITNQQKLMLMIQTLHATKAESHASSCREDPQENEQKFNLHG